MQRTHAFVPSFTMVLFSSRARPSPAAGARNTSRNVPVASFILLRSARWEVASNQIRMVWTGNECECGAVGLVKRVPPRRRWASTNFVLACLEGVPSNTHLDRPETEARAVWMVLNQPLTVRPATVGISFARTTSRVKPNATECAV